MFRDLTLSGLHRNLRVQQPGWVGYMYAPARPRCARRPLVAVTRHPSAGRKTWQTCASNARGHNVFIA